MSKNRFFADTAMKTFFVFTLEFERINFLCPSTKLFMPPPQSRYPGAGPAPYLRVWSTFRLFVRVCLPFPLAKSWLRTRYGAEHILTTFHWGGGAISYYRYKIKAPRVVFDVVTPEDDYQTTTATHLRYFN